MKTLRNLLIYPLLITNLAISAQNQKEIILKGGYKIENNFNSHSKLKLYDSLKNGEVFSNGKEIYSDGIQKNNLSIWDFKKIDKIKDKFLTAEEIEFAINKEYEKAFNKYAQKILGLKENEIETICGKYKFPKNLKEKVIILGDAVETFFKIPKEEFYDSISGKDAVMSKKEINFAMIYLAEKLK